MADSLNLKALISEGIAISQEEKNRSYLLSSFKRTVQSWEKDFKKIEKEKSQDKKDTLQKQLIDKIKKEAEKYLSNTKDFADDTQLTVAKNPKALKTINDYKAKLEKIQQSYKNLYDKIENTIFPSCKNAYNHYQELLKDKYLKASIDLIVKSIKDKNADTKNEIQEVITSAIITSDSTKFSDKFISNDDFLKFVSCYTKIKDTKDSFTKWLEDEYKYLEKFKSLNEKYMLEYQKHGAYIEYDNSIQDDSNNLTSALGELYSFCEELKAKNSLKNIGKRFLNVWLVGRGHVSGFKLLKAMICGVSLLAGGTLLVINFIMPIIFASSAIVLSIGFKILNNKNKPLFDSITNLINKTNNRLDSLVNKKTGKNDLNIKKVVYMKNVKEELTKAIKTSSATPFSIELSNKVNERKNNNPALR